MANGKSTNGKGTNRPSRRASNRFRRTMKRYPDIPHRDRDVQHITTTYGNMPRGGNKKDSVSYRQGFDAGKLRVSDGYNVSGGYLGPQAVESSFRQRSDKYYGAGYKAGSSARTKYFQQKDRNKRKRNR